MELNAAATHFFLVTFTLTAASTARQRQTLSVTTKSQLHGWLRNVSSTVTVGYLLFFSARQLSLTVAALSLVCFNFKFF